MELRAYWELLCRRWWLILGLPILTAALSFAMQPRDVIQYRAVVKLAARPVFDPQPGNATPGLSAYNAYLYSEYLLDDLSEVIKSAAFMADVRQALGDYPGGPPNGAFDTRKVHRVLTLSAMAGRAEDARALAEAASRLLTAPEAPYARMLSSERTVLSVVDPPAVSTLLESRSYVNVLLRLALGLVLGVALALLLETLDDRLRTAREVGQFLGLPVLGEVPRPRGRPLLGQRRELVKGAEAEIA